MSFKGTIFSFPTGGQRNGLRAQMNNGSHSSSHLNGDIVCRRLHVKLLADIVHADLLSQSIRMQGFFLKWHMQILLANDENNEKHASR